MSVAVRAALDRVTGTYSGVNVQSIAYMNEVIDFDEGQRAYNVSSDYDVRISRTDFEIAQGSPITGVDLGDLADVNTTGVTDGQVIAYDAATAVWLPATDAGGAEQLNDLSDVIISQPAQGEFFRYDGDEWVNDTANKSDVGLGNVDNTSDANKPISTDTQTALDLKADITSVPTELDDLNDVQIIGTPTLGQALVYGAGKWLPGAAGATDLGDLDDVNTTGAAFGSLLTYNGASWDISAAQLPTDDIYFHQRYETESEALRTGATATTELYFTCTAQGNGLAESASSDTPTAGKIIKRKIYYSEEGFADPDTGTWVEFTPAPADDASFATVKAALLEYLKARTGGTVPISLKQTWEEVAAAPAFTGLLNETYGSGAEAAYSTRRLNGNYSGACMTIRRTDGTTQTIGFDASGNISEADIISFCTGSTCTVQVWHDQSQTGGTGSGNDAEQTNPNYQPTIYTGGQLVKEGGRLALDFQGDSLNQSSFLNSGDDLTFVFVSTDLLGDTGGSATPKYFMYTDTGNTSGSVILRAQSGSTSSSVNSGYSLTNYVDGTAAPWTNREVAYDLFKSGQRLSFNYGSVTTTQSGSDILIGNRTASSTQSIKGKLQEMLFWTADKSGTDQTSIQENIGDYFTQNTPLLDTYSGAAAAYSLRLLDSTYTGSAIRVRRSSDNTEQDIGFNVFGELDTVSLLAFAGTGDAFVKVWYDQASTNDATQTVTGSQPQIVSSGTVIVENGKPSVTIGVSGVMPFTSAITTAQTMVWVGKMAVFQYNRVVGNSFELQSGSQGYVNALSGTEKFNPTSISINGTNDTSSPYGSNLVGLYHSAYALGSGVGTSGLQSIGWNGQAGRSWAGDFQELIIYSDGLTSERAGIEANINTFYNIY